MNMGACSSEQTWDLPWVNRVTEALQNKAVFKDCKMVHVAYILNFGLCTERHPKQDSLLDYTHYKLSSSPIKYSMRLVKVRKGAVAVVVRGRGIGIWTSHFLIDYRPFSTLLIYLSYPKVLWKSVEIIMQVFHVYELTKIVFRRQIEKSRRLHN